MMNSITTAINNYFGEDVYRDLVSEAYPFTLNDLRSNTLRKRIVALTQYYIRNHFENELSDDSFEKLSDLIDPLFTTPAVEWGKLADFYVNRQNEVLQNDTDE